MALAFRRLTFVLLASGLAAASGARQLVHLTGFVLSANSTQVTQAQTSNRTQVSASCITAPTCLEPQGACLAATTIVEHGRPECQQHEEFCSRKVYKLPTTGLKITLPVMTNAELSHLYSTAYGGQMNIASAAHWRPTEQAQLVMDVKGMAGRTGLTIVEMGCAGGFLLYNLRLLAAQGGKLICFEADPDYKVTLEQTLQAAKQHTPGLTFEIYSKIFSADALPPGSVDIFLSSHVVEHVPDPCVWMQGVQHIMKPGGVVFTEVPDQYSDPEMIEIGAFMTRGLFHLLYFNKETFDSMMDMGGFESINSVMRDGGYVRALYRKPLR